MSEANERGAILTQFDKEIGIYKDLADTSHSLLTKIFEETGVQLHSITSRCKSRESLAGKLAKRDKDYRLLSEITDLAAVRITTYFAEDVDRVAEIAEKEFLIDKENSVDKRSVLDPDRFGYQSLHYIALMTKERTKLTEYSRFQGRKIEIQIRSILQHAWAEIEHDLGYKSAAGVPREIRRRFSRVAGLLELADEEFSIIRKELQYYASNVTKEIANKPESVEIDKLSLDALIKSEKSAIRNLSQIVANIAKAELTTSKFDALDDRIEMLHYADIYTVDALERLAASKAELVSRFAKQWITQSHARMTETVGILYLIYVLLAETNNHEKIDKFAKNFHFSDSETLPDRIFNAYQAAIK